MSVARVAVLQFPGLNCEEETLRVLHKVGVEPGLVRWNEDPRRLEDFAGYFIPGGWSYQDRVRGGAIAAKSGVLDALARQAESGKPVLGICNGAQILVEAGLAPGRNPGRVEAVLARNRAGGWRGYHARWVFVRPGRRASCFFTEGLEEPIPVPIAHAEGRFRSTDPDVLAAWEDPEARTLTYCTAEGGEATSFPADPNGSTGQLAGIAGLDGQVLAFMPHPERGAWLWQVPEDLAGPWGERRRAAVGDFGQLDGEGPGMQLLRAFGRLNGGAS